MFNRGQMADVSIATLRTFFYINYTSSLYEPLHIYPPIPYIRANSYFMRSYHGNKRDAWTTFVLAS